MRCDKVLTQWLYDTFIRSSENENTVKGTILSGSEFVASPERKLKIKTMDDEALLVEMEAAALCQVARKLKIPIGIAKSVVDPLYPEKTISEDYKAFLHSAARHSKAVIESLRALRVR